MADVLSQAEIDALLNAAQNGGMDTAAETEKKEEKQYRKYDFYSPRKFTKDKIKMLNGIFEGYCRTLNSHLNGILRTNCEILVDSLEELRYYEFSNALSDGDILTLADVTLGEEIMDDTAPVLLHFTNPLMLTMMDRLLGGEGGENASLPAGYTFTDVELKLYESLVTDFIKMLGPSWSDYIDIDFNMRRVETNPTLVQVINVDETVLIIGANISFEDCSGRISICIPGTKLLYIFDYLAKLDQNQRKNKENNSEDIMGVLKETSLEITAELGRTRLRLQDIYFLKAGDLIDLGHPATDPIHLRIGGKEWFTGKIGLQKNNMAVKITETCHNQEGIRK